MHGLQLYALQPVGIRVEACLPTPLVLNITNTSEDVHLVPLEGIATGVVAKCTFLINSFPLRVLFNLVATHSFIDYELIHKLAI